MLIPVQELSSQPGCCCRQSATSRQNHLLVMNQGKQVMASGDSSESHGSGVFLHQPWCWKLDVGATATQGSTVGRLQTHIPNIALGAWELCTSGSCTRFRVIRLDLSSETQWSDLPSPVWKGLEAGSHSSCWEVAGTQAGDWEHC